MTTTTAPSAQALADGMRPFVPADWLITVSDDYDRTIRIALPTLYVQGVGSASGAGLRLNISSYRNPGRVVVYGVYPQQTSGRSRVSDITVALSRGPEAIVKDITRRLLPGYLSSYAHAVEEKQKADDYQAAKRASLADLAAIVGVEPHHESAYYYANHIRAVIKNTYSGSADLELTIPHDLAARILRMVVGEAGKTGE